MTQEKPVLPNRTVAAPLPSGWRRPVPVKHDSNFRAWMFFLAGVCLVVALWIPVRTAWQQLRYKPESDAVRNADSFIVLAYSGVSAGRVRGADEVSREQFAGHIRALHEHGFNPIGLEDVRAFYKEGKLLPRQAVLITMEQSKKSSYLETRGILQEYRWQAAMFVRADTINRKENDVLRWPIIRDMMRSGTWSAGAQSIDGFAQVPAGPAGEKGNFFSTPRWLDTEKRLETVAEFSERIDAEHRRTIAEFRQQAGDAPVAFAFPYGDYGQYDARAVATRVLNLAAVGRYYDLGFALGPFLLNTVHSDPRALNRLLVNPKWSVEEFISIIESSQAVKPWVLVNALSAARWRTIWGITEQTVDGGMTLRAVNSSDQAAGSPGTGGLTWMFGSDLFEDFTAKIRFRLKAGHFGVRMRYRSGGEEGLRFLIEPSGIRKVMQKLYGSEEYLVASETGAPLLPDQVHELVLSLRGRTMIVQLDGRMVMMEPLELMAEAMPGLFGFEIWDPVTGAAEVEILKLEFPRQNQTLLYWDAQWESGGAKVVSMLNADAWRYAAISPPWMDVQHSVPLVLPGWDDEALKGFAGIHGLKLLPRIRLASSELAVSIPAELPVNEAVRMGVDGFFLDCRQVPVDQIPAIMPWLQDIYEKTKENNMKLAIALPDALTKMATFASIAGLFPGALIAVDKPAVAAELEQMVTNVVVSELMVEPPRDMHLSLYHQLAVRSLPTNALSVREQQQVNRTEGLLAYHEAEYQKAIDFWQSWLAEDPQNSEAMSLIGRAYLKMAQPLKALEYYTRSLEAAPGQISMAVRCAELLDTVGRVDEAREKLNLYARIFPENPDILIAQAQWLNRRNRRVEARSMLETLVKEQPMNIAARVALLDLQDSSAERYRTMRDVLELGEAPGSLIPFGNLLLSRELLTYPESGVFFDSIRRRAELSDGTTAGRLYEGFLPLTGKVTDDFALGRLSDVWIASDGIKALERGRYELRTAVDQAEAYLRLQRSELLRDGCLDVVLDDTQGFFWIYARRSARSMVRFGFDQDGFIHIQAWHNGELLSHLSKPWIRPPGSLNMRLLLRGDGARGFVNGMDMFDAPLDIPPQVAYGWWGIAPFSFELGLARARIIKIDCEPLPSAIALTAPGNHDEQIVKLREVTGMISAVAPAWIFQKPDGTLPDGLPENAGIMRMFCAFHRVRLLPVVDLSYDGAVDPGMVVEFISRNKLTGIIVKRRTPPGKEWLDAMQKELEKKPANVIIMHTESALWNAPVTEVGEKGGFVVKPAVRDDLLPGADAPVVLTEIPVGSVLLSPLKAEWPVRITAPEAAVTNDVSSVVPALHLLGDSGWLEQPEPVKEEPAPVN